MEENKNFNELLIEILKQIHVRLDRLDAKINTKADKEDLNPLKEDVNTLKSDVNTLKNDMNTLKNDMNTLKNDVNTLKNDMNTVKEEVSVLGQRLDRIEGGITTLRWVIGAQVAIIGVILAIFKAF